MKYIRAEYRPAGALAESMEQLDPFEVLNALIRAGLGSVPQVMIDSDQFRRAMAGEKITPTKEQLREIRKRDSRPERIEYFRERRTVKRFAMAQGGGN